METKREFRQVTLFKGSIAVCCIYNFIAFLKVFVNFRQVPGYRTLDAFVRALMEPLYQYREIKTFFEPFGAWIADPDFALVAVNLLLLLALVFYLWGVRRDKSPFYVWKKRTS